MRWRDGGSGIRVSVVAGILLVAAGMLFLSGQNPVPPQAPPQIERNLLNTVEGPALFQWHCAVCHGKDASGDGPAALTLKKRVPDLTRISQRNGGTFPFEEVQ